MLMDMRTKPVNQKARRKKQERGFTLTEIAIVLGIIGLILGAIWVAAAAVYTNLRTSKTTTELLDIVQNVRAMYATSGVVDPGADMTLAYPPVAQAAGGLTYVQGGIFPADMVDTTGTIVQNPWNGEAIVKAAKAVILNDSVEVIFDNVPLQACITAITSTTGTGKDPGLFSVATAATGGVPPVNAPPGAQVMPVPASTAQTLCKSPNGSVGFTFKLK